MKDEGGRRKDELGRRGDIATHRFRSLFFILHPSSFILLLSFILPLRAVAMELSTPVSDSVTIVETLKILHDETTVNRDDHFWAAINRFNLGVTKSAVTAGLRYDTEAYFEKEQYRVKYWLEKAYVQYERDGLFVRGGDFYNRMGYGLVLSLLKRDEFGLDNTLRGGLFQWEDRDGHVEVRVLGGWVNEGDDLSFQPERASEDEPDFEEQDTAYGGQISAGRPGWGFLEVRYLRGMLRVDEAVGVAAVEMDDFYELFGVGGRWLNFGGHGSISGEYAWYELEDRKKNIKSVEEEGRAAYGSLNLDFGPVTLLFEGQDYYRFTYPYAEPPILEFEKQTFGHVPDRQDIIGGRGYAELFIPGVEIAVHGNYYRAVRHQRAPDELANHYDLPKPKDGKKAEEWVEHSYGGVEKIFDSGAYAVFSGGYREEPEGRWLHGEVDGGLPLSTRNEITLEARWKSFRGMTGFFLGDEYGTWTVAPTWNFSPHLSLTGRYEFSDEPLSAGLGGSVRDFKDEENYISGECTLRLPEQAELTVFYGRIKGGLFCSGGVCREVPPYEGLQADITLYF